ncbi:hypothetical protein [Neobacillus massiliamazoniensis]|uniref:Uncharacterized protein n=1 Tax=Neobacillus massiliamazoniensis TaxID=1499688 RepID=A0A0U1NWZ3_9BACI|nr:hypothetical protein [Neobacillus massiliamazoniensis]CRK82533.1 hypothetical protein BN000_02465 [Neobacillus massiliamazoniensis]
MILNQLEKFEEFLVNSFGDGMYTRELRLSNEEVEFVQKKYPKLNVKKCFATEASDGKCWYEVSLSTPIEKVEKSSKSSELHLENLRLKLELERLKNSLTKLA